MIPYGRQDISQDDIDAVVAVLRSDWLTQGPVVPKFEAVIGAYSGVEHVVAVSNATCALHIACMALGVGSGDRVWTSPNTFVASANAALYCGAEVDFVDIDPHTYNMSVICLEEKLLKARIENRLPKVVIPVHFAGQSCEMLVIHRLAKQYGFLIIEDASHAIGGRYEGSPIGNCQYSDITVFSFHPVKIITTGEGGAALTNNKELADRMRLYRSHGITNNKNLMELRPDNEIWNYQQIDLGFNFRMTDIQAALGMSQILRVDEFVQRRHFLAKRYNQAFKQLPIIKPLQDLNTYSSWHLYSIRVCEHLCQKMQKQVYELMLQSEIAVNVHYIPVYRQPYYEQLGFKPGLCPEAELYHRETLSLPIYYSLTEEQQDRVILSLTRALE